MGNTRQLKEFLQKVLEGSVSGTDADAGGAETDPGKLLELLMRENVERRPYPRVMGMDEKRVVTAEAFGYLLEMVRLDTIDIGSFEKIMGMCVSLQAIVRTRITLPMMQLIVDLILFSGNENISLRDLMEIFTRGDVEPAPPELH